MVAPVAVTGAAWSTALGHGLDAVWRRLLAGEHGFVEVASPHRLRNTLAAVIPPHGEGPALRLRRLAVETLGRALARAGLVAGGADTRFVLGTSLGAWLDDARERELPLHTWADEVAREVGAREAPVSLSTACSSGSDAILVGAELIRSGAAEVCVCAGVDVLTPSKRLAHSALSTMSPTRPRAFDTRHDGMLLGEGAGCLVLESMKHARGREAPLLAVFRGAGSANDAASMTSPDPAATGARLAMERALADAGVAPVDIGVVNAHGSATPANDRAEAEALRALFGAGPSPLVFATKGAFGHTLGATGTMEAIALILALREGVVPPVAGLEQPERDFPCPLPMGRPVRHEERLGLSLTLGFGGFDTALVFEVPR
ncbi:beta-ketoacyl-[acyl-carrier-protein] synthase family protein [Myxococcus vastator]|uniref:beta-ketoacyl-[acyl-carrier-protein] synthase family protein n=1 Tax=Myxococcus vastator TaxID=2709664 RepID=UPI0013D3DD6F|nr:beta-ketoacyl-[acyl-carrier-protein] synthase family protein [Myxococcus vastator]